MAQKLKHPPAAYIQEIERRRTPLGTALYIKIQRYDALPMSWRHVWDTFADRYPGKWAIQSFPPAERLVDEVECYHLLVFDDEQTLRCKLKTIRIVRSTIQM